MSGTFEHIYEKVVKLKQLYKENLSEKVMLIEENKALKEEIYQLQLHINKSKNVEESKDLLDSPNQAIQNIGIAEKESKQKIDQQQIQLQLDGFIEEIDQCIQIIQAKQ